MRFMPSCRDMTENATSYLEGRLGMGARFSVAMHVLMCRHCRRYYRQLKRTISLLAGLALEPAPQDVEDRLLQRFRERTTAPPRRQSP